MDTETNGEVDWGESVGMAKQDRREKARRSTKGWNSSWMLVVRDGKAIVKEVTRGWGSMQMDCKGVLRMPDRRGVGLGPMIRAVANLVVGLRTTMWNEYWTKLDV